MSTYAMIVNNTVIDVLVDQEKVPHWPPTPDGTSVTAIICDSHVQRGMVYIPENGEFISPEIPAVGEIVDTPETTPSPEKSQLDRIEEKLNALTADTVTAESIDTAIWEGVNEV